MSEQSPEKQPSAFKQEWEAKKLLKRATKKAKKSMQNRGHGRRESAMMVNKALKTIVNDNRPERKAANRGG